MRERPILFSGPMVRAILEGRKTQTRRVVKPQPTASRIARVALMPPARDGRYEELWWDGIGSAAGKVPPCPYGVPGDRLWVRETWTLGDTDSESWAEVYFRADGEDGPAHRFAVGPEVAEGHAAERERLEVTGDGDSNWKPSIFMPRWASRLTLEVKAVRVERLQEISQEDAREEGIRLVTKDGTVNKFCVYDQGDHSSTPWSEMPRDAVSSYRSLWDSINAKHGHLWESNPWVWVVEFERVTP